MQAVEIRNRRYRVDQGGAACLVALARRGVIVDVVDHKGSIGLGVYRRDEGEETINIKQT